MTERNPTCSSCSQERSRRVWRFSSEYSNSLEIALIQLMRLSVGGSIGKSPADSPGRASHSSRQRRVKRTANLVRERQSPSQTDLSR